jgi:hypothetical protein
MRYAAILLVAASAAGALEGAPLARAVVATTATFGIWGVDLAAYRNATAAYLLAINSGFVLERLDEVPLVSDDCNGTSFAYSVAAADAAAAVAALSELASHTTFNYTCADVRAAEPVSSSSDVSPSPELARGVAAAIILSTTLGGLMLGVCAVLCLSGMGAPARPRWRPAPPQQGAAAVYLTREYID